MISAEEATGLLNKLKKEAIPVVAHLIVPDGCNCRINGVIIEINGKELILGSGFGESCSFMMVPLTSPYVCVYSEVRELSEEERSLFKSRYGESMLSLVFATGSRLSVFFAC